MTATLNVPPPTGACPFCGVASGGPHESQEGCIAALHDEIGRMRGILATLRPAGVPAAAPGDEPVPSPMRIVLSRDEIV